MPSFGFLKNNFFGNAASTAAGVAAGAATSGALTPGIQAVINTAWTAHPDLPIDAYALAEGVAQGQVTEAYAKKEAAKSGISGDTFDALVNIANTGPGVGEAYRLWRRGFIDQPGFIRAVTRAGLETEWITALVKAKLNPLDPADLARGIHKSLIPDPGLLAVPQPTGEGTVKAYPVYEIDALAEAQAAGYDKDHLGVLVGLQGNPMGAHEAAQAQFRGVIEPVDYDRAIAEGNTRNEWGHAIREQSRQIPTSHEFIENALRGYSQLPDALAGAAKHGMTEADATILYQNAGRPLAIHQITTGLARGAQFHPIEGELKDPYEAFVHESNIKPSYYDLAIANKYSYPSLFQLNALVKASAITADTAKDWATKTGLAPEVVDVLYLFWKGESSTAAKPKKLTNATIRSAWKKGNLTEPQALADLESNGLSAADAAIYLKS